VYGKEARIQWSQFGEFAVVAKAEVFDEHMQHHGWPMALVYCLAAHRNPIKIEPV
jgi:hypothetical protein